MTDAVLRFEGVGSSQEQIVEAYLRAFPTTRVDALAVQFALASVSTFLREGIEATIRAVGYDLSRPRYTLVRMLYLSPERELPKAAIADGMHVSGAYVTQLLVALEADGWVERVVNSSDRRMTRVRLTPEGIERCSQLVPQVLDFMVGACGVLSEVETAELQRLLSKILHQRARIP